MSSWESGMSDEKQNVASFRRRASASTLATPTFPTVSPFCHSCQTNQMLILSIMANADSQDMEEEATARDWQACLEARYPPVCTQCRDMVTDRIEKADKLARRLIWNGWLNRRRSIPPSPQKANGETSEHRDSDGQAVGLLWTLQCAAFILGLAISLATLWRPPTPASVEQVALHVLLLTFHLLSAEWDPTVPQQAQLKRRSSPNLRVKVQGRERFATTQVYLFAIRTVQLLAPLLSLFPPPASLPHISLATTPFFLLAQCLLLVDAARTLRVVEPESISLKSRPAAKMDGGSAHSPALGLLSLHSDGARAQSHMNIPAGQEVRETQEAQDAQEEMDWSPTLAPHAPASNRVNDDFQLGPQRFFEPVRKTGLEDLLDRNLALHEERAAVEEQGTKRAGQLTWWAAVAAIAVTLVAALAALDIGHLGAALTQLSAYVHQQSLLMWTGRMVL